MTWCHRRREAPVNTRAKDQAEAIHGLELEIGDQKDSTTIAMTTAVTERMIRRNSSTEVYWYVWYRRQPRWLATVTTRARGSTSRKPPSGILRPKHSW